MRSEECGATAKWHQYHRHAMLQRKPDETETPPQHHLSTRRVDEIRLGRP